MDVGLGQAGLGALQGTGMAGLGALSGFGMAGAGAYGQGMSDYFGAQERLGTYGTELMNRMGSQTLEAQNYYGQLPFQYQMPLTQTGMNLLSAQQPQAGMSPWLSFAHTMQGLRPPEMPEQPGMDWLTPTANVATSYLGYKGFGGPFCVDLRAEVRTPRGMKQLLEVHAGDEVMSDDGVYRAVLYVDKGIIWGDNSVWRQIELENGWTIALSPDHVINGKPAEDWGPGDFMPAGRIKNVELVDPRPCADLLLEGGAGYYANGFPVGSMMALCADKLPIEKLPPEARKVVEECRKSLSTPSSPT
jgi:hypothetical protein